MSYSAMSVTNLFSSHLVGQYCNSKSHLSVVMARRTMTPLTQTALTAFSLQEHIQRECSASFLCFPFLTDTTALYSPPN